MQPPSNPGQFSCSDLLTARFRVRIPVPEPLSEFATLPAVKCCLIAAVESSASGRPLDWHVVPDPGLFDLDDVQGWLGGRPGGTGCQSWGWVGWREVAGQ